MNRQHTGREEELLTPHDVAKVLRQSRSFVFKTWRKWMKYGVRPIRINRSKKGHLLFRKSEIDRLLDRWSLESKGRKKKLSKQR